LIWTEVVDAAAAEGPVLWLEPEALSSSSAARWRSSW
jgi:hypothetical protein